METASDGYATGVPVNSKRKGIRGEQEAVQALRSLGLDARRTQQYQGYGSDGDIVIEGAPGVHCEVKCHAQIGIYSMLEQATRDCKGRKVELLLAKGNRKPWFVGVYLDRLPELITMLQEAGLGSTITETETSQGTGTETASRP